MSKGKALCCGGDQVKALPFILSEIKRLNRDIEKEHSKIIEEKQKAEDSDDHRDIITSNVVGFITGTTQDLTCDTGFVEFKNLTAKQSALQCNITGTNGYMTVCSAPDPRDMIWENATVERKFIKIKNLQCDGLLFTGTLFWYIVVSAVTVISDLDLVKDYFPAWMVPKEGSFTFNLVEGYLPVIFLELLMLVVPFLLKIIATKFIRFKTHSEVDAWVYRWHFAYRVANLIIIIVKREVIETLRSVIVNPKQIIDSLAADVSMSSQFFLNNMLVAAGTETLFELSQFTRIITHFVLHQFITIEATSKRTLERLEKPVSLEWGDVVPKFIFSLLVGSLYSAIVPVVTGSCALFFYIAAKVYTHQALFIYAQPYEGGGKLMYQLNRSIFVIIYTSITTFAVLLTLKKANVAAGFFFFVFNIITFLVDRRVTKTFITPGLTLALTNARIIDEQNKMNEERSRLYREYKAVKVAKMREASRETKASRMQNYNDVPSDLSLNLPSHVYDGKPSRAKKTRFSADNARPGSSQSRRSNRPGSSQGARSRHRSGDFSDDENDEGKEDFYLYRQPSLNRTLWETKPRAYW